MFNFKDELAKYRESLSVDELSEGLSGDEIQDIVDVAQELARQALKQQVQKQAKPAAKEKR